MRGESQLASPEGNVDILLLERAVDFRVFRAVLVGDDNERAARRAFQRAQYFKTAAREAFDEPRDELLVMSGDAVDALSQ